MTSLQASKGSKSVQLQEGSGTLPNQRRVGTWQQNKTKDIIEIGHLNRVWKLKVVSVLIFCFWSFLLCSCRITDHVYRKYAVTLAGVGGSWDPWSATCFQMVQEEKPSFYYTWQACSKTASDGSRVTGVRGAQQGPRRVWHWPGWLKRRQTASRLSPGR